MSDLVGNPENRFSHNEAHFISGSILLQDWCYAIETVLEMQLPWRTLRSKLVKVDSKEDYVLYNTTFEECQIRHRYSGVRRNSLENAMLH